MVRTIAVKVAIALMMGLLIGCGGGGTVGAGPVPDPGPGPAPNPDPGPSPDPDPRIDTDLTKVPNGLGVDIRTSVAPESEWDLLADAGFKLVRFNMHWSSVEKSRGVYNFKQDGQDYDRLVEAMASRGIRVSFHLAYENPLYDQGYAPHTPAGRAAFARFAAACAARYKGEFIIWEIWNEPNVDQFWRDAPKTDTPRHTLYAELAREAIVAMRVVDPAAVILGPSVGPLDRPESWEFIREMGRTGVLAMVDGVSVHPYRSTPPETAVLDYDWLEDLIRQYVPAGKPIYNTEVGRSTGIYPGAPRITEDEQARRLVQTYFVDRLHGVPLTVWYNWADLGLDRNAVHDNFGVVTFHRDRLKPSYHAARVLSQFFEGFRFVEAIDRGLRGAYVLRFEKSGESRLVLWAADTMLSSTDVRIPAGSWQIVDIYGTPGATIEADGGVSTITLGPEPIYLRPVAK